MRGSETSLRSVVTERTTTKVSKTADTTDTNEPESEQNVVTRSVVTETTSDTAGNVIEIVPTTDPTLEVGTAATELEPNRDTNTNSRSVVTGASDTNTTGETGNIHMNTQQRISKDYAIPEEIASEALLMLQNMSQPNPQELDDNDKYALLVGTERLPDIVSEMNEERGINTVVNYDADIPEEMKLQTEKPRQETQEEGDKGDGSDETIIYDASEFDEANKSTHKSDKKRIEEGEKSPKAQLRTQTYGIIKQKPTSNRTYTCIDCGAKRKSKQEINQHYREEHSSIKCPDCDRVFFQHRVLYNDTDIRMQLETSLCVTSAVRSIHLKVT